MVSGDLHGDGILKRHDTPAALLLLSCRVIPESRDDGHVSPPGRFLQWRGPHLVRRVRVGAVGQQKLSSLNMASLTQKRGQPLK